MDYSEQEGNLAVYYINWLRATKMLSDAVEDYHNPRPTIAGFQYGLTTTRNNQGRKLKSLKLIKPIIVKQLMGKNAESGVERPAPDEAQNEEK